MYIKEAELTSKIRAVYPCASSAGARLSVMCSNCSSSNPNLSKQCLSKGICLQIRNLWQNPLTEDIVRRFLSFSRNFAEKVLEEKELMEINLWIIVVFASQSDTDSGLVEAGFDLVLVCLLRKLLNSQEWLRHTKLCTQMSESSH